jgi:hypothetical protein
LIVTEYDLRAAPFDSLPLAICCAAVESAKPELPVQAPPLPPATPVHCAVTADVGTVAQLAKVAAAACTLRVQVLLLDPPDVVQLIVAAELPVTAPESGSVDVKLIVLGLAETAPKVVGPPPIGKTLFEGTTTRGFV